jgi:protein translocase SecG subunit
MTIFESIWFIITIAIIALVLIIDPKNSVATSSTSAISGFFASPSSSQNFIYRVSAILIVLFYVLTVVLSFN